MSTTTHQLSTVECQSSGHQLSTVECQPPHTSCLQLNVNPADTSCLQLNDNPPHTSCLQLNDSPPHTSCLQLNDNPPHTSCLQLNDNPADTSCLQLNVNPPHSPCLLSSCLVCDRPPPPSHTHTYPTTVYSGGVFPHNLSDSHHLLRWCAERQPATLQRSTQVMVLRKQTSKQDSKHANKKTTTTTTTTTTKKKKKKKKKALMIMMIMIKIMMIMIALIGDLYNLLTAPRPVSNTFAQVPRAQSCSNHVKLIGRLSRGTCLPRIQRDSSAMEFGGAEPHLF